MAPKLVDPHPLKLVLDYARTLTDVSVTEKTPHDRPDEFIRIEHTATRSTSPVTDKCDMLIQATAPTPGRALELAEMLRRNLWDIDIYVMEILGWEELTGPVRHDDPSLPNSCRFQFSGAIFQALD